MTTPESMNRDQTSGPRDERLMRLFLRNEGVLRAYARTLLPDIDSVDDALQDAYLTMYDKFDQLRDDAGFLPWGKVILRFKCLSLATKMRRSRPVLGDDILNSLAELAEEADAETLVELREAFDQCLARFPSGQRELLLAPYFGDGRVKQLAEEAGKSVGALYMALVRLREKLSRCVHVRLQDTGV